MQRLTLVAAIVILALWAASIIITFLVPERSVDPSLQVAMVAVTTFLFGTVWLGRRKD